MKEHIGDIQEGSSYQIHATFIPVYLSIACYMCTYVLGYIYSLIARV